MIPSMYISWLLGPALQAALLAVMLQRKLHRKFPQFFFYILFQIIKTAVLFIVYRHYQSSYFDAYWTGNAVSILLAVLVMDEILHNLFEEYGGIQNLGSLIFRWACGLLLLLSIVNALSTQAATAERVVTAVLSFDRSVRLMQCGLVLLLLVLCRIVSHCWRQHVFGIALGFGASASVELILVSLVMHYGNNAASTVSLINSGAYNLVTLIWIAYLSQRKQSIPQIALAPQLNALNLAIVESSPGGEVRFLSMVEEAVDRVLSRGSWQRPPAKGPHVVARKPEPEEHN